MMNGTRYITVLDAHLLAFMDIHGCITFQQDSAPCHKAKAVTEWLRSKQVDVLNWACNSPDLHPIKNLWTMIKQKVSWLNPSSLDDQKQVIKNI